MKKLSVLLAVLLMLGMLAGCNSEEASTETTYTVPGYYISVPAGKGWTATEDPDCDLELTKDGMKLRVLAFTPGDFVDPPTADDLWIECTYDLADSVADLTEKEAQSSYNKNGADIMTALYAGTEDGSQKQFYCFIVAFNNAADTKAWVMFSATADQMKKNKSSFKAIVDGLVCTAPAPSGEDGLEEELIFDENGELIVDETEPVDIPYETEPAPTATPANPQEAEPQNGTVTEQTVPTGTTPAATGTESTTPTAA